MPAVCISPHSPDCLPPSKQQSSAPPAKGTHPLSHAMHLIQNLQHFLPTANARGPNENHPPFLSNPAKSYAVRRRLRTAESYMSARLAGRNADILPLIADSIVLVSSRDGQVRGKPDFERYLSRVKASGTWRKPTWNATISRAQVLGNVRILMLNVGVVAHFGFDRAGRIDRIDITTRRKKAADTDADK